MNVLNILYRNRDKQNVSVKTKRNRVMKSKLLLIAVCSILLLSNLYSQTATHPWHTVDNGGGKSTSGSVTLRSSWGQPNVQKMTALSVKLESGYLPGLRQLMNPSGTTAPPTPTLALPMNSALDQSTTIKLSWHPATGASSYRLQVSVSSSFATTAFDDSTVTDTSHTVPSLLNDTLYYWRVNAKNIGGTSGWSNIWSFTTIGIPSVPTLVSPTDNAQNQPTTVKLIWNKSSLTSTYEVQVSTDSSFAIVLRFDSLLVDTTDNIAGLTNSTQYYWRARAKNIGGVSGWSNVWRFKTMIGPPSTPILVSPLDSLTNQPTTLYLRWRTTSLATSYHLQLAKDSGFTSNVIVNDSTLTDTSFQMTGLSNDTTYYWRTRAKGGAGYSAWSSPWRFTTIMLLPNQVTLVTPSNNAVIGTDSVVFVWFQSQPKVTRYWFEFAVDSSFIFVQVDTNVTETFLVKRSVHNQAYWWRIRAFNLAGWGPYSEVRKLTVNVTDVANERSLPTEFALEQNYPNPFNPSTVINYQIPVNSWVTLKVYNMLGQEVTTLVDGIQEVGYKSVEFYSSTLPSGIYTYRLQAGTFIDVKKMLLLK